MLRQDVSENFSIEETMALLTISMIGKNNEKICF